MIIFVSPNSKNVCLLVYETTNKKYKTGSVLNIIQMSEKKDCIEKQNIIDNVQLSRNLELTDNSVTYFDIDGNSYNLNF